MHQPPLAGWMGWCLCHCDSPTHPPTRSAAQHVDLQNNQLQLRRHRIVLRNEQGEGVTGEKVKGEKATWAGQGDERQPRRVGLHLHLLLVKVSKNTALPMI